MNLKLVGGEFKSRLLKTPSGLQTRPTSSFLRKAVFDICKSYIEESHFLDLFAGSGAMGLEAISRGASHATFIDKDRKAIRCILENIRALKLSTQCKVIQDDAFSYLKKLKKEEPLFDIVYIDPPYGLFSLKELVHFFDKSHTLREGAVIFIEESFDSQVELNLDDLCTLEHGDTRKCGHSLLHQFFLKGGILL